MNDRIRRLLEGKEGNYVFPFFWQHGEPENVLRDYMQVICDSNIKAVCVESRPHPDFLGEGWWRDMDIILDEARKKDMKVWILDDSHFPTGYANGALEKKDNSLRRQFLTVQTIECPKSGQELILDLKKYKNAVKWKPNAMEESMLQGVKMETFDDDCLFSVSAMKENGNAETDLLDLSDQISKGEIHFKVPDGKWQVKICHLTRNRGPHRNYINMLDKKSCRVLIDTVYEPHYQHYAADFGKTIAGFFSDEPEIGNGHLYEYGKRIFEVEDQPWSSEVEECLKNLWKEKFHCYLPLIWEQSFSPEICAHVRFDYMSVVTEAVEQNFSFQIGDWCREHGVEYIGHLIEDNNQHSRTGSSLGHYFRGLSGQDMAGIDDIGGQVLPQGEDLPEPAFMPRDGHFYHYVLGKLAASAAAIEPQKKGRSMCELFGAYGWMEGVKLEKFLLDHFLVCGINHFVPHAFSAKEFPDPDCPPHFYAHGNNPQYRHFGMLMKYANRMCELISGGSHIAPVAILYQGESDWCSRCMQMQEPAKLLSEAQINYDFIPSDVFRKKNKYKTRIGNRLQINEQIYEILVVPEYDYIPSVAAQAISEFCSYGGKVIFVGNIPKKTCEGNVLPECIRDCKCVQLEDLAAVIEKTKAVKEVRIAPSNKRIRYLHYKNESDVYIFTNEDVLDWKGHIQIHQKGKVYVYNPWANQLETAPGEETENGISFEAVIEPLKPLIIVFDEADRLVKPLMLSAEKEPFTTGWKRSICRSIEYPLFKEKKDVNIPDNLAEEKPLFSGFIRYENKMCKEENQSVWMEVTEAWEGMELFVNDISAGIQVAAPFRYDLTELLHIGENEIAIEVATTLEREMSAHPDPVLVNLGVDVTPHCGSGITGMIYIEKRLQDNGLLERGDAYGE